MAHATVVFSELQWMGTGLSTADEWLEIAFVPPGGSGAVSIQDLSGWFMTVLNSSQEEKTIFTFPEGSSIGSGEYVVLSNYDAQHSWLEHEPTFTSKAFFLPNTKLFLRLYTASGTVADSADDGIGAPFAGENASGTGAKRSMERVLLSGSGGSKENWVSASTFIGLDDGAPLFGTPGYANGTGLSSDVRPPKDATNFSAHIVSGTLISTWIPGTSLDLHSQEIQTYPAFGTGKMVLPASATGFTLSVGSGDAIELRLYSTDTSGHTSSGVTTIGYKHTDIPPSEEEPQEGSGSQRHPGVYITEVLANPIGKDDNEWIEIGNLGTGAVSISGWILDEGNSPTAFTIPDIRTLSGAWPPKLSSGFVLGQGEYVSFRKTVTSLPLGNKGEQLTLLSGSFVLDSWEYPETAEEVSYGRNSNSPDVLQPFCRPTEGAPNTEERIDPLIVIQSGDVVGTKKLSINLQAEVLSGSLASAQCAWQYGDGFTSDSCNPPSHTFTEPGLYEVSLTVRTLCETISEKSLQVEVLAVAQKQKKKGSSLQEASQKEEKCTAQFSSNVVLSEFFPNPYGEESDGEWIELWNSGEERVSLCGWQLDDEEGGSKPYIFGEEYIEPGSFLLLPRSQTKVALNNDADTVRLFAGSGNLVTQTTYGKGVEGETMGLREDGYYVWSPYPTPGEKNKFRDATRRFPTDTIILSAALPNPVGKDAEAEWVELANVSDASFDLSGWFIDNKEGGSPPFELKELILLPNQIRRFSVQETGVQLVNTKDSARLLDPDGYLVSLLSWTEAVEGRIYRPPVLQGERVPARVVHVVDGDTIDIVLTDMEHLDRVPGALKRKWIGIQNTDNPSIRVRLIGIDTPETVHPGKPLEQFGREASNFTSSLLEGKNITLEFDTELFDKYERLLAYVYTEEGASAQAELLRRGFAYVYLRFPFARSSEYAAYENEAKSAKLGLWSSDAAQEVVSLLRQETEEEVLLEEVGLTLTADPLPGLVASGTEVRFTPSPEADVYLSVNSGSYSLLSGGFLLTQDSVLRAYAERGVGTGSVRSTVLELVYILPKERYEQEVLFTEIYPSPVSSGSALETEEWVELRSRTGKDVHLAGWILDDIPNGGSKPRTIGSDIVVPASGSVILLRKQTGVALNNDGDTIRLLSPDGVLELSVEYPKIRKGQSYALVGSSWCVTDSPTPSEHNICTKKIPVQKVSKTVLKESASTKKEHHTSVSRRFVWERYHNIVAGEAKEHPEIPAVWQSLRHLQGIAVPEKKSSSEAEVLIFSLLLLPALRFLTM